MNIISRKKCILILLLVGTIGLLVLSVNWIRQTPPKSTRIELTSFGGIFLCNESRHSSYKEKTQSLTAIPAGPEGIRYGVNGKAQLISFFQTVCIRTDSPWTADIKILINNAKFVIFDVTDNVPTFGYNKEKKYYMLKQVQIISDSANLSSTPIPTLKTLLSLYSKSIVKNESLDMVVNLPLNYNKNHDKPMATLLFPENVNYFCNLKKTSSLFIRESSYKNSPGKMGLEFHNFSYKEGDSAFDEVVKMAMQVKSEDKKKCAFLLYLKNLDIILDGTIVTDPNKKYLVYVEALNTSHDVKISILSPFPGWFAYAKSPETFSFCVNCFNSINVSDPEGTFSVLDSVNKIYDYNQLSSKFIDFPGIGTEDYFRFSQTKNTSSKKIIVKGMATSFKYQGVQYIKERWALVPPSISGAIIGGLIVVFFTKLIDMINSMMKSDKVHKVHLVKKE